MNAPATRGAAIAAYCKGCIYDPAASGNWKEQVSACRSIECPLWRFRPLGRGVPEWIKSRNPADLPDEWIKLHHDEAVRRLRGRIDAKAEREAVQAPGCTRAPDPMPTHCPDGIGSETHGFSGHGSEHART